MTARTSTTVCLFLACIALFALSVSAATPFKRLIQTPNDTGACNNTNDLGVFNSTMETFHGILQDCAKTCLGGGACTATCLAKAINLTADCSTCFGNDVACGTANCFAQCFANPADPACIACNMQYCEQPLLTCAGVPQSVIPTSKKSLF